MTYEDIKRKLQEQIEKKDENENNRATTYQMSYFFGNDMGQVEKYCNAIDNAVSGLKNEINSIISKINTELKTSFHVTHSEMSKLSSSIPSQITESLRNAVLEASKNAFNKYTEDYEKNKKQIDSSTKLAQGYLTEHQKLLIQIDNLNGKKRTERHKEIPNESKISSWNKEIKRCEERRKKCLEYALQEVNSINELNMTNIELLTNGLRKA